MAKKKWDYQFKVLLLGDSAVGKTSIVQKYAGNPFETTYYPTIGVDFKIKYIEIDNKVIQLQIWDTAGQERFLTITSSFYRDAKAILLVYDITNSESFDHIERWMRNIEERVDEDVVKMIVGNKSDIHSQRVILTDRGKDVAESYQVPFLETSAKDNTNIDETFTKLARKILEKESMKQPTFTTPSTIQIQKDSSQSTNRSCCW